MWLWHWKCLRIPEECLLELEADIEKHTPTIWKAANIAVIDESMNPHKGRKNPNHVYIPRKPKGNGLKVSLVSACLRKHPHLTQNWMTVEFSGFCLMMSLFRRHQQREAADDTLLRMAQVTPQGSLIVADSLFGGMKGLEKIVGSGRHGLFSVRKDRPSSLFKNFLEIGLNDGHTSSCRGEVLGQPFIATMTRREKVCPFPTVWIVETSALLTEGHLHFEHQVLIIDFQAKTHCPCRRQPR